MVTSGTLPTVQESKKFCWEPWSVMAVKARVIFVGLSEPTANSALEGVATLLYLIGCSWTDGYQQR